MAIPFDNIQTPTLTKAELAQLLFDQIGLNKREAKDFIDEFFDLICAELVKGHDVKLAGFGNFEIKQKAARPGRNPRTGKPVPITPRRVVTFKASAMLKERMNNGTA